MCAASTGASASCVPPVVTPKRSIWKSTNSPVSSPRRMTPVSPNLTRPPPCPRKPHASLKPPRSPNSSRPCSPKSSARRPRPPLPQPPQPRPLPRQFSNPPPSVPRPPQLPLFLRRPRPPLARPALPIFSTACSPSNLRTAPLAPRANPFPLRRQVTHHINPLAHVYHCSRR